MFGLRGQPPVGWPLRYDSSTLGDDLLLEPLAQRGQPLAPPPPSPRGRSRPPCRSPTISGTGSVPERMPRSCPPPSIMRLQPHPRVLAPHVERARCPSARKSCGRCRTAGRCPSPRRRPGPCPTAWTASVWKRTPFSLQSLPIALIGWRVPISLLAAMIETRIVLSVIASRTCLGVDLAVLSHRQVGDLEALPLEPLAGVEDWPCARSPGDDVVALLPVHLGHALDREVVGLGAAGGEDDLLGIAGADELGDLLAGLLDGRLGLPAERVVAAGGVAELLGEVRQHRLDDPRVAPAWSSCCP